VAWQRLKLDAERRVADALGEILMDLGALSVSVMDAAAGTAREEPIFGEPGETARLWEACTLSALFTLDADVEEALAASARIAGLAAAPAHAVERLEDQDWVARTQELLAPVHASPRVWVVHSWHVPPDPAAVNVLVDPGTAFGTGGHATTRLCLAWLDEHVRGGETVLDWGTGSGILAIAALKLGAARAIGVDVDEEALRVAAANAQANDVAIDLHGARDAPVVEADLVVANILASPLKALAPLLARAVRPGGALALSGILVDQAAEVAAAYPDFAFDPPRAEEGWVLLGGRRG